jgi:alpha-galactosidase
MHSTGAHALGPLVIALIGAGSRSFGPETVRDVLLSDTLAERRLELRLMDIVADSLAEIGRYAHSLAEKLRRNVDVRTTATLEEALAGAQFVVTAVEVERNLYWAQDYHVPRKYGFRHVFGENGGPGSLFHALRTMKGMVHIARTMEGICPNALLLNYSNPMHKVCDAIATLSKTRFVGLCHGVWMGMEQIAFILDKPMQEMQMEACGINHFTWFQTIRDRRTGEDLYPRLREAERDGDWLADWHEIGLARILLRRFGLYPSPASNHIGEYIGWAHEFCANELDWFYDPADGRPWEGGRVPEYMSVQDAYGTDRPFKKLQRKRRGFEEQGLAPSGELAIPIMESLACGKPHRLDAINVPNRGFIPNLPGYMVVEIPGTSDATGLHPKRMQPLPEAIAAIIRLQGSINKLLVEAFAEESKSKLLQAVLLEPTVTSYRGAVEMVDEMLALQRHILPPIQ